MMINAIAPATFNTISLAILRERMAPARTERQTFADRVRAARAARTLRTYARFGAFGRVLILTDESRVKLDHWTGRPNLNIHRAA